MDRTDLMQLMGRKLAVTLLSCAFLGCSSNTGDWTKTKEPGVWKEAIYIRARSTSGTVGGANNPTPATLEFRLEDGSSVASVSLRTSAKAKWEKESGMVVGFFKFAFYTGDPAKPSFAMGAGGMLQPLDDGFGLTLVEGERWARAFDGMAKYDYVTVEFNDEADRPVAYWFRLKGLWPLVEGACQPEKNCSGRLLQAVKRSQANH